MFLFFKDIVKGMRRRKKELLLIVAVEFFATLFVAAALLFQHNAGNYTLESNRYLYGDWTIAEVITDEKKQSQQLANHPYFEGYGTVVSGCRILNADGTEYAYRMGYLDDAMIEVGHVALREGRFPENAQEIVMETSALTELGYSFELGQQIPLTLYTDEFGSTKTETFELVGILKGSLSFWDVGVHMPGALVTKEVLENVYFQPETTYCYYLKEQYQEVDTAELFSNLDEAHFETKWTGWQLIYNNNLYAASFWDSTELYTSVERMVLVVGMAAMSFLLAAYIQKRKKYYYDLRIIGMSKLRVKLVILWESLCACVPGALFGIPGALLAGAAICSGLCAAKDLEGFYEIPLSLLGKALVMWLLIFAVSTLIAMLITGNRRLYSSGQSVSLKFLPRWSLNKLRHNRRYSSIFIREHRMFRVRNLMGNLVGILFAAMIMFCGVELWRDYESYQYSVEFLPDFRYSKYSETDKESGKYVWNHSSGAVGTSPYAYGSRWLSIGFSDSFFEQLNDIPGVVSYTYGTRDDSHLFAWDDMQEDPYIVNMREEEAGRGSYIDEEGNYRKYTEYMSEVLPENTLHFGYQSWFPHDTQGIFNLYLEAWGNELMNYNAFEAGEQVFLICNEEGLLLKEGDNIRIEAGESWVEVQVAAVIPQTEVTRAYFPETTGLNTHAALTSARGGINKDLYLIGSEQLAKTIAEKEGTEFRYNWIDIKLNQFANYNLTIKQCAQLLASEGASGKSNYDILQQKLGELVNNLVLYGMFVVMLVSFFMILRANIIQSGLTFQGDRMKRLRMLGMEKRQLRNMYLWQGLYEARWSWLAIPVVYLVKAYQLWKEYNDNENNWSAYIEELGGMTSDPMVVVKYRWTEQVDLWVCLVVLAVMILLHVLTRHFVSKGAIAALDEVEKEE